MALSSRKVCAVDAIQVNETVQPEEGERPSIVLRMAQHGERLWDIAKAYGTTISDIVSANELEETETTEDKLLLIPRKR